MLDTGTGRPAAGIGVRLLAADGTEIARGTADADGRLRDLGPGRLPAGPYRLRFDVGAYYSDRAQETFFPEVDVAFVVGEEHVHVPLLLSPFAYSTYRGS